MRPSKILTEQMIRNAMKHTSSNFAAARFLKVNIITYRKYASLYKDEDTGKSLYEAHINNSGKGIPKPKITNKLGLESLRQKLIQGINITHTNINKIKNAILTLGLLPHECSKCGFCEKRMVDYKMPLLLSFKDGDKTNVTLPNIQLLCYNCYFLHVSDIFTKRQEKVLEDITAPSLEGEFDWDVDNDLQIESYRDQDLSGDEFISRY